MKPVQRYVYRHKPYMTLSDWKEWCRKFPGRSVSETEIEEAAERAHQHHEAVYRERPFEKEGGGLTTELSEAKLIGWRSARNWDTERGDLIPARIVLED